MSTLRITETKTSTIENVPTEMDLLKNNLLGFENAEWSTGDGTRIRVRDMTNSHLHYALAKAYRNEYPDYVSRSAGIAALKAEAARRLLGIWVKKGT
jgi:hypothetical protein